MSIVTTLATLVTGRQLILYRPTVRRAPHPQGGRKLWLTPDAETWCLPSNAHPDARITEECLAHLRDQFNAFVWGEFMDFDGVDMRRLCPEHKDIWEIKSHLKKPQLRVLGWFALPKLFVASHYAVRDDLEEHCGPKWDKIIDETEWMRHELVGNVDFFDVKPGEYVKNPK
jgi:hypothetical protein